MYIRAVGNLTALMFWLDFVCLHYIIGVRWFEFQAVIKKLLDVKRILLIIVAGQFIVRVLGQVVLVAQKRPHPPQL